MGFRSTSVCYTESKEEAYTLHIIAPTVGKLLLFQGQSIHYTKNYFFFCFYTSNCLFCFCFHIIISILFHIPFMNTKPLLVSYSGCATMAQTTVLHYSHNETNSSIVHNFVLYIGSCFSFRYIKTQHSVYYIVYNVYFQNTAT